VGARLQKVEVTNFNQNSGAISSAYDEDAVTPMVGVVVKPVERLSVYANYIQALQAGASAPTTAANAGEVLPPYKTAQYELGAKRDFGTLTATVAVYQITQPSAYTNPNTNRFDADGEQRHRGVDFNLFGEVVKGFRVLGGVAYIDSELRNTLRGANDGNQGIGVSKWRLVMGAGWDAPFVPGLTLTARGVHNDAAYLDPANRQRVPAGTGSIWARAIG
jgi:iron complex outermembrane receptor protein